MSLFETKAVTIEADQFIPEQPWPEGVEAGGMEGKNNKPTHYIETKNGTVAVVSGDWIVKEIDGKGIYSVCDPIFKEKYRAVEPVLTEESKKKAKHK